MTCIVGIVEDGRIHMGADSAGIANHQLTRQLPSKVFYREGGFVIGFTSSFRMGQLIQYKLEIPECQPNKDPLEYIVVDFIESLRACFKSNGFAYKDREREYGGTFLIGFRGHLFRIEDEYQVIESAGLYDAVGSGRDLALGSLHTNFFSDDLNPRAYLNMALEAAAYFSTVVSPPFNYISIDEDGRLIKGISNNQQPVGGESVQ